MKSFVLNKTSQHQLSIIANAFFIILLLPVIAFLLFFILYYFGLLQYLWLFSFIIIAIPLIAHLIIKFRCIYLEIMGGFVAVKLCSSKKTLVRAAIQKCFFSFSKCSFKGGYKGPVLIIKQQNFKDISVQLKDENVHWKHLSKKSANPLYFLEKQEWMELIKSLSLEKQLK